MCHQSDSWCESAHRHIFLWIEAFSVYQTAETFIIHYCALWVRHNILLLSGRLLIWHPCHHLALWCCSRAGEWGCSPILSVWNSSCYFSIPSRGSQRELQTLGFTYMKKLSCLAKSHFSALFTGKAPQVYRCMLLIISCYTSSLTIFT